MNDNSDNEDYRNYMDKALKVEEIEAEFKLLQIRSERNRRKLDKYEKDTSSNKERIQDNETKRAAEASVQSPEFAQATSKRHEKLNNSSTVKKKQVFLGKDRNERDIYIGSTVALISKSRSRTADLYNVEQGVAIGLNSQGWVKLEAFVKGKRRIGSRKQSNLLIKD